MHFHLLSQEKPFVHWSYSIDLLTGTKAREHLTHESFFTIKTQIPRET